MKKTIAALILGAMAASQISAHHAFAAEFDVNKPLTLKGKVVKMEWINPHTWIHVAVVDEKTGQTITWMIEGGPPNGLIRRGFTKDSLPKGTEITVTGWQAKDDSFRANGSNIVTADGKKLFLGSSNQQAEGAEKQ
jgi:DNA/RNA endonuclease YhcR with UshA esterase domain